MQLKNKLMRTSVRFFIGLNFGYTLKINNMKILKLISVFAFMAVFLISCNCVKGKKTVEASVIRDCTGTYLRIANDDYLVCNSDILKDYQENSKVKADFSPVTNCPENEGKIVCMMYHENKGMVRINGIQK